MQSNMPPGVYHNRTMMPAQGGAPSARLTELLEAIKNEFEAVTQDTSIFKMQRDEFEHKIAAQINEMTQIQQNVYELERAHQKMKQHYEEEIMRLRRELESRGIQVQPSSILAIPSQSTNTAPPVSANTSLFGGNVPVPVPSGQAHPNGLHYQQQQQQQQYQDDHQNKRMRTDVPQHPHYHGQPPMQMAKPPMPGAHGPAVPGYPPQMAPQPVPPMAQSQPQQQPRQQTMTPAKSTIVFGDVDLEAIPAVYKREGPDYLALFNPKLPRQLDTRLIHSLDHASVVCCVKFSADGKYLATGCNKTTQIFDIATGQKIASLADDGGSDGDLYIRSVCFSPDSALLATGAEDRQIRLWDIKSRTVRTYFTGHEQDIYSLDFSRDGRFIVSGSGDRTAKIWDVESGRCLHTLGNDEVGPKDAGVTSVAISPDGRFVAAGSLDRIIRIWDVRSGQFITRLEGHKDSVYSVTFSSDGKSLVSGSLDKTLKLWDLVPVPPSNGIKASYRNTLAGHKDFVLSVAFSPDGNMIVSGSKDRFVQIWDHKTGHPLFMLQGHKNSVISVAVSPAGNLFATGSGDCRARIWSIEPFGGQKLNPALQHSISALPSMPVNGVPSSAVPQQPAPPATHHN